MSRPDQRPGEEVSAEGTPPRFTVEVMPAGYRFCAPAGATVLQSALAAGVALPTSCRNGTCRACICSTAGPAGSPPEGAGTPAPVRYEIAWPGLSAEEKQAGWLLPCAAYPTADLVLWQPAARAAPHSGR